MEEIDADATMNNDAVTILPEEGNHVFDPTKAPHWYSAEATKLFVPASIEEDTWDAITWWVNIFESAQMQPNGYKNVIIDGDPFDNCTENDILKVREKCLFLIKALRLALLNYPKKTWRVCCKEAAMACSEFGSKYKGRMVECWWHTF